MVGSERISVIIPVYNTEKYLEKSVRSVMDQTYGNLEIICVNDGSTDGSAGILRRLQQEDPRIVIVEKENGGLGDARNAGLGRATSEWVSFLDSDDTLRTDTYEIISGAFGEEPDLICFGIKTPHIVINIRSGKFIIRRNIINFRRRSIRELSV